MSESDKMGLFGSKDEHNESTSKESKSLEKSKEKSPDHYAPYNIDSDSETYDTEALSMMDINDIIGVQADNTADSTLESEFAALSEIITDSRDEFSLRDVDSATGKETANKSDKDGAQRKKMTISAKQDNTDRSGDKIKLASMSSISKSLQLIGEAYISEDSQETDNEDVQESSTRKIKNYDESLLVSKDSENPKLKEKLLTEQTENSSAESSATHTNIKQAKDDLGETEKTEVSEKLEALGSTAIATFEDSTLSLIVSDAKELESSDDLQKISQASGNKEISESAESLDYAVLSNLEEAEKSKTLEKSSTALKSSDAINSATTSDVNEVESSENLAKSTKALKAPETTKFSDSIDSAITNDLHEGESSRKPSEISSEVLEVMKITESADLTDSMSLSDPNKAESTEILEKSPDDSKSIEIIESAESMDCPVSSNLKEESTEILEKSPNDSKSIEIIESAEMDCPVSSNFKEESTEILGKSPNDSKSIEIIESAESMDCPVPSNLKEESTDISKKSSEDSESIELDESAHSTDPAISKDSKEAESTNILEKSSKDSESTKFDKSTDSTDSAIASEQLNDNIENMDVDLPSPTNTEKFSTENQTIEISKQSISDIENVIDDSDKKLPVIETENSTIVSEEVEEPMEVDEPNENLPKIVKEEETPVTEKEAIENHPETSKPSTTEKSSLVNEGIDIPPEETKKLLPDDLEKIVEISSCEEKIVDKVFSSSLLSKKILETVEEESEPESVKSPENAITDKKIEMETEELEQSIVEDIPSKIPDVVIEESIPKLDEQEPRISSENVESQSENISSKEIEEIVEEKKDEEETIEPMEIDNPEETETKDDSHTIDPKVAENTAEFDSSEITEKTSESAENSSEIDVNAEESKILEKLEESSIDVSTALESCNESAETIATRQKDSLPVTSKESFEKDPIASESCKKSSDIVEITTSNSFPVRLDKNAEDVPEVVNPCETSSGVIENVQVEPHYSLDEDEKMEVDGSLQRKIEEPTVPKIIEEKKKEKSEILSIDTVDNSSIALQEINAMTDVVEISHFSEISSDKTSKIVPSETVNEVVSEKPEEKKEIAPEDESMTLEISTDIAASSLAKSPTVVDEEIPKSKDDAEAKEKSSNFVEISQSDEKVSEDTLAIEMEETVSETNEYKEEFKKEDKSSNFVEISQSDENVPEDTLAIEMKQTVSETNEYKEECNKEDKSSISLESSESLKSHEIEDTQLNEETSQDSMEIKENKRDTESKRVEQEFLTFSEEAESSTEQNSKDVELSEKPVDNESERNETESPKDEENETTILDEKGISKEDDDENSNLTQNVFSNEEKAKSSGEEVVSNEESEETVGEEIVSNEEKEETPSEIIIEKEDEEETSITTEDAVSSEKIEETSTGAQTTLSTEEEEETLISAEKEDENKDEQDISTEHAVLEVEENSVLSENINSTNDKNKTLRLISAIRKIRPSNDKNDSWLRRNDESTIFNRTESKTESSFDRDDIFSKPKVPLDESNLKENSINAIHDANNEDPIDDEMNLSLDPEIIENPERMILEADEEMEDNVEMNLSLDPDDKDEETTSCQIEDCPDEKTDDNYEETTDKSIEDSYANSKDIMSSRSDCETEIFRDDEQSQSTQEMMESILETDKGNINKILDDEEADCDALERRQNLESSEIDDIAEKLPNESDELLSKALDDPMTSQNIDSLEGLLDLDLMPENDEPVLKSVEPIIEKVMKDSDDDVETIDKNVDVSLLIEDNERNANDVNDDNSQSVDDLIEKSTIGVTSDLIDNELEAFNLNVVDANPMENSTEDTKMDLAEDLLRDIAVEDERKMELAKKLMLESGIQETDLLLSSSIPQSPKIDIPDEVFLDVPVESVEPDMELTENLTLEIAVPDQVLDEVAAEIVDLPPTSEISELESAVKFLQESEEHDIESPLVLSPKMVEGVVDDITTNPDVVMFPDDNDICDDPTVLVAELESIIPDPIAISEAEIINEAAKLESERKTKITEEAKSQSPNVAKIEFVDDSFDKTPPIRETSEIPSIPAQTETPKTHREAREIISKSPVLEKIEQEPLKKSAPIPKISILEERLKIPPKIEIPQGEMSRIIDNTPTTPRTSLLIQRDSKSFQKMLESPKSMESKAEHKIVDTPRKDTEKYDFENVGSPRIILKIAKAAFADCSEPRSPKSPKIRSTTNSPNPEDSPGQKLGKIKLKLSKSGHPSIIPNDNAEELCGQWHTEGSSSLSPLGMKIKFSKIADTTFVPHGEKHDEETTKEPSKHKFEEAKRTDSPIGMKIKLSRTGEPSIIQQESKDACAKHKEKLDILDSPKRTESPIGVKIKLSKYGDASIIQPEKQEIVDEHRDSRTKEKIDTSQQHTERSDTPCRTESPLGIKFKLFKTGDASIVQSEATEDSQQEIKRTDSPLGMKIKLSKNRGGASIVSTEISDDTKLEIPEVPRRTESPLGMKIKLSKTGDASIIHTEEQRDAAKHKTEFATQETSHIGESQKRHDTSIGMKIKLSKSGDASIVHPERDDNIEESRVKEKVENLTDNTRKTDATIGMKIKFLKTGDATIIPPQMTKQKPDEKSSTTETMEIDNSRSNESIAAMKIKLQKSGEGSIVEIEKKEKSTRRKDTEMPLEIKIKLSKTGHPTIVTCENYGDSSQRGKDCTLESSSSASTSKHKESSITKEITGMKSILKSMQQSANLHAGRSELTIEPIHLQQSRKSEKSEEFSQSKRKDITISPIEAKKTKLEAQLSQIFPEVTIQPVVPREQKQKMMFDAKAGSISRQQMNVISQEISITQVRPSKPIDLTITEKLKSMLKENTSPSRDCEIIEHRPELIIVNENSNSSQDVMIIEEVPALRGPDVKTPKKRGRPRRNPLPLILAKPMPETSHDTIIQRDPLALDDVQHMVTHIVPQGFTTVDSEASGRPKRTCRSQKSYAPPRRGRGRGGRGKRKMDMDLEISKRPRIEQDLDMIERSTTALITIHEPPAIIPHGTSELYKALRQPTMDRQLPNAIARVEAEQAVNDTRNNPDIIEKDRLESLMDARIMSHLDGVIETSISNKSTKDETFEKERKLRLVDTTIAESKVIVTEPIDSEIIVVTEKSDLLRIDDKIIEKIVDDVKNKDSSGTTNDQENWLTPSSKKLLDGRNEGNISNVQVMDEETRMSAESVSRSQTPAKNISVQAPETIVNEESQGSVLSTATTESEKVKAKTRRMEITLDPDEGPFTVDRIAEYDWPLDPMRKGELFMIQEQISQYLGVKSFKRKYPDLKRRMVDMEERNYLRENALVSEAMCDMGLTAVCSSEVLDVMCSDFPDQYEEYRKYIREKQMKEHLKKQKELTAAANAEKNRIDLAEMAVQSALSWNVGLNKARRESRKCSLDLQTFTIHVPKKQQKIEEEDRGNHYPVALIPGQYTDYYREYTPAELRYYPLNTVLYGPMKPNERKFDSQSEGSQSDSDSDSSSDDSSSSSSEGTQDTEASQSTMDDVDVELSRQKEDIKSIKCKMCLKHLNKFTRIEVLIQCGTCNGYVHPSCIDLTLDMVPHIQAYAWQCTDCKTCAQCHDPADEDKMLFCDMCDRGYHIYCVGLRRVPQGRWHCQECAVCASCGSREAGGANSDRNSVAQWQHEYKKGDKNTRVYVSTLCVPCSKLCGDQGSDNRQEKLSV